MRAALNVSLASIVLAATLVAACGGGSTSNYGEAKAKRIEASAVTVDMKDLQFAPQGIKVKVGTTVTWTNDDGVVHNVRQIESAFLSPDEMQPGASYSFTFTRPGTFRYQCTYHHPSMNGVVIVEAA